MPLDDEPRALVADILSEIITYVKQSRPTRTDGTATQGFVYSQMRPGQMISPRDSGRPWTPSGGTAAPPPAEGAAPGAAATEAARRASFAAANTAAMVDTMIVVTDDGTYTTYSGGGRRLSLTYKAILNAMEADPPPPRSAEDQARIDTARAVLWNADQTPTAVYDRYRKNQLAYATAVATYKVTENRALADEATRDSWPILAAPHQVAVDQAYDQWKSQGADEVEAALAAVQSLGVPLEQGMISDARQLLDTWSLSFEGVATRTPYSRVLPSEWALLDVDDIGWTSLEKTHTTYNSHFAQHGYNLSTGAWRGESSSVGGEAGVSVFGFGFSGRHSQGGSSESAEYSRSGSDGSTFSQNAKELSIKLEYGLCQIVRPWLLTDLFRMRNWHLTGYEAASISDGTIAGQVGKEEPLLPLIPTHFLVIRNVEITARDWGDVRNSLTTWWGSNESQSSSSTSSSGGGVSIPVLGPLSLGGGASVASSESQGSFRDEAGNDHSNDFGARFDGETLKIKGAQVIAWLSEVIPASPPQADEPAGPGG